MDSISADDPATDSDEKPQYRVSLNSHYIGKSTLRCSCSAARKAGGALLPKTKRAAPPFGGGAPYFCGRDRSESPRSGLQRIARWRDL